MCERCDHLDAKLAEYENYDNPMTSPSQVVPLRVTTSQEIVGNRPAYIISAAYRNLDDAKLVYEFAMGQMSNPIKPDESSTQCTESDKCDNPKQCWEPCGELGNSLEHARVVNLNLQIP